MEEPLNDKIIRLNKFLIKN